MKSKNLKKIESLKKGHGWLSIIVYLIFFAFAGAMLTYILGILGYYVIQAKLASEYESVSYMARIYDRSLTEETGESVWALLEESEKEFIIRDKSGKLIYGDKGNTCDDDSGKIALSGITESVIIYPDEDYPFISAGRNGNVNIELVKVFATLNGMNDEDYDSEILTLTDADEEEHFETIGFYVDVTSKFQLRLPVWMGCRVNKGKEIFIGKGYLTFKMSDLSMLALVVVMLIVMFFTIFNMFIVNMVREIRSRKRSLKMLFMDIVTAGKNRTWFFYKGDSVLKSRFTASNQYAIVNLIFVKYTTYCACHSVAEGEAVLRGISECIDKHITRGELNAHGAPKEFMLLLKAPDTDALTARLNSLIEDLERFNEVHAFTYQAGVVILPPMRDSAGRVVRRRDIDIEQEYNNACTARGTLGDKEDSGIAYFDLTLIEERKWQDWVEANCRLALQNDEYMVYYQPKYDPVTSTLKGAEALIRWKHTDDEGRENLIAPGKFIPIFEKNGFITNIDHYMLSNVARDQKRWLDKGFECVPVSVNISRAHFIETDLAEQIRDTVDAVGAPRNLIEIELTESAFFDDKYALVRTINRLKEYGFKVSMDDFGSGYSSLNSLKDMPLDVLKLDAEFFRGENAGERGRVVVSETIKLARKLNMLTVAEGIEDREQVEFLAEQGCDMIQGYVFARPMSSGDYEIRMTEKTAV
ncbi:MAG: EAL domain-containing protein [Lachnospiraceae bacterium]|nr:EAL domain-containing protein [Lachnospiraceae bacterium]